jgi:hypothetical protein
MRKLDDGTYMYDTDSPWSYVTAWSLALLATGLVGGMFAYFGWVAWKEEGAEAFAFWKGSAFNSVLMVFNTSMYSIWLAFGLRRAIRRAKSKVSHD